MSHTNWIIAGGVIATAVAVPMEILNNLRETEQLTLKIKQNLELAPMYHGNESQLNSDVKHLNDVAATFAMGYGVSLNDTMEMMQVLSRRFKSPEELTYYTNLAMVMHKLDFVSPKKAAEDLEATILSMGLNFEQSKRFIDEFSVAVHTARITGTELLTGLQRSAATFHNMNFNTAEAIAMISTLSTVTAKAGANVGASLNSVLINIDFKKAAQALKAYSIEVYDANGKMRDGVEIWRQIAQIFNGLDDNKANEFANAISGGKFRANDLRALIGNWQTFEQILKDINTQASPELTAKLLQTGMESLNTQVEKLKASLTVLGISLSEEVMPSLSALTMGLTEGVQWLNKNKDAVNEVIRVTTIIAELLLVYKANQFIANSALGTFVETMYLEIRTAPSFKAAMLGMGNAMLAFARTVGIAFVQLAAFQALARMMEGKMSDSSEKSFLKNISGADSNDVGAGHKLTEQERNALSKLKARDEFVKQNAISYGDNSITGKWAIFSNGDKQDEFNRLNNEAKTAVAAVNGMASVNDMVEEATKKVAQIPHQQAEYPHVQGQDIGDSSKDKSSGAIPPESLANKLNIDNLKLTQDIAFSKSKIAADIYSASLDQLNTKESIYGNTIANTIEKQTLMTQRMKELATEENNYRNAADKLDKELNNAIGTNDELLSVMGKTKAEWDEMSNADKAQFKIDRKEILQQLELTKAKTEAMLKYREHAEESHKTLVNINDDLLKQTFGGVFDEDKNRETRLKNISLDAETKKALLGNNTPMQQFEEKSIDYQAEVARYQEYLRYKEKLLKDYKELQEAQLRQLEQQRKEIEAMDDSAEKTAKLTENTKQLKAVRDGNTAGLIANTEAQKENSKNMALSAQQQDKLKDKFYDIREAWANNIADMIVDGRSGSDILKGLMKDLAREAIMNILKVHSYQSLLAQTAGKGKGAATGGDSLAGINTSNRNYNLLGDTAFPHAVGGRFSQPHLGLVAERGSEWIIPTENNTEDSRNMVVKAGAELGMWNKGEEYVSTFKNKDLAAQISTMNIQMQQDKAQMEEMRQQTKLIYQQNQVLVAMFNKIGTSGGNTVVQPIVMQQKMTPAEFQALQEKSKNSNYR